MGGKGSAPSGPSGADLIAITEKNIASNEKLFKEYMSFAKDASETQSRRADSFYDLTEEQTRKNMQFGDIQRERYLKQAVPLEDSYVKTLTEYDTPARREQRAGEAVADTTTASRKALESARIQMERRGVDPSMVRGGSLNRNVEVATALAGAGAATRARTQSELQGIQMKGEGVNVRKGLPSSSAQALSTGLASGQAGLGATGSAAQLGMQAYGQGANMIGQGQDIATSGYSTANSIYGNDIAKYDIQMANSPVNIAAGLAGAALGGGILPLSDGGYVDPSASPSRGARRDDIPAALDAGEVVLTADEVRYHGLKTLSKMSKEAREAMGAIPTEAA